MANRRSILNEIGLEDSIVFENPDYDSAIVGYDSVENRIVYDYEKMVDHLMDNDGMTYEEAVEFIEYNTIRAIPYAGSKGPIVYYNIEDYLTNKNVSPYEFNAEEHLNKCINWCKDWFQKNAPNHKAVIGMSGGKDSTIAATILAIAIGANNVIGVAMPDDGQGINDADEICKFLGIKYIKAPISGMTNAFKGMWREFGDEDFKWSHQAETNIPPRVRMTMLYAIAQTYNGIVVNTCNLSESYLGYETIFGDLAGGMSPIKNLTATEIIALGDELKLPSNWVHKTPDDGLPNSSPDEEKFGFTYETLDRWIRTGEKGDTEVMRKIFARYEASQFKRDCVNIQAYNPNLMVH